MRTAAAPILAFTEEDADRAYNAWRCNCGPTALAACLGLTLDAVRPHLGDFERRGYMNPTMMGNALTSLKAHWRSMGQAPTNIAEWIPFPGRGVVRIQWGGPWLNPGVPIGAAYARTHWIASWTLDGGPWVFDVNGGWRPRSSWEGEIVPLLIEATRKADGSWFPTHRWEVA
jgi:hypothetical protein